uniref:Uncharacterized protein n=1 Tax=Eutreptiella gymnastica TaxID=73025 RepID=A0A7S1IPI1_9EUGL|mmetsp:Transcript_32113/g.57596  ORF Transcript_32113/g.57596 Transcript_32113/m.57596 type:complete len:503 (+) Transcript_32113:161-1669(+)
MQERQPSAPLRSIFRRLPDASAVTREISKPAPMDMIAVSSRAAQPPQGGDAATPELDVRTKLKKVSEALKFMKIDGLDIPVDRWLDAQASVTPSPIPSPAISPSGSPPVSARGAMSVTIRDFADRPMEKRSKSTIFRHQHPRSASSKRLSRNSLRSLERESPPMSTGPLDQLGQEPDREQVRPLQPQEAPSAGQARSSTAFPEEPLSPPTGLRLRRPDSALLPWQTRMATVGDIVAGQPLRTTSASPVRPEAAHGQQPPTGAPPTDIREVQSGLLNYFQLSDSPPPGNDRRFSDAAHTPKLLISDFATPPSQRQGSGLRSHLRAASGSGRPSLHSHTASTRVLSASTRQASTAGMNSPIPSLALPQTPVRVYSTPPMSRETSQRSSWMRLPPGDTPSMHVTIRNYTPGAGPWTSAQPGAGSLNPSSIIACGPLLSPISERGRPLSPSIAARNTRAPSPVPLSGMPENHHSAAARHTPSNHGLPRSRTESPPPRDASSLPQDW